MNKEQLADFTQAEFDEKYAEIFTDRTSNKQPADNPYACVLGGQPGAGKTTIHGIIGTNYPDIVIINADDFRQYHPRYKELQAQYGADDVKYTQPFINAITEKLIADLSDKKYHLGIEGTLRTPEVPRNTCNALKSKGYSVELAVMAIDETVSWQGTLDRAEKTKLKNEIPRYTPKEHHDKVVATLPDNLETLYQDKCFDRIWLVNRQSEILYDTDRTPNLSPKPLIEAVLHETERNIQQNIPVNDYPPPRL